MTPTTFRRLLAAVLIAGLLGGCGDNRGEEQVLADASKKIENLSYRSAIIELRNLLRNNPKSLPARVALAGALLEVGDFDAADKELSRAVDLGATPDQTYSLRAKIFAGRGEFALLLAEINPDAVESPALASELRAMRGRAMLGFNSKDEAISTFEGVLAEGQSTEAQRIALLGLATVAEGKADFAEAERLARQSLEIAPDSAESMLRVGQLLIVQTRFDDAIAFLSDDNIQNVRVSRLEKFRLYGERAQ
ncbi:MAG: tetratricopeptide repeat protein, partial [Pseudomonadota bacterium]